MSDVPRALTDEEWTGPFCKRRDVGADEDGFFSDGSRSLRYWHLSSSGGQVFVGATDPEADHPESILGIVPTADHALMALCNDNLSDDYPGKLTRLNADLLTLLGRASVIEATIEGRRIRVDPRSVAKVAAKIEAILRPRETT